jgi:hypothetical protein
MHKNGHGVRRALLRHDLFLRVPEREDALESLPDVPLILPESSASEQSPFLQSFSACRPQHPPPKQTMVNNLPLFHDFYHIVLKNRLSNHKRATIARSSFDFSAWCFF